MMNSKMRIRLQSLAVGAVLILVGVALIWPSNMAFAEEGSTKTHVVGWGETIYRIASQYGVTPQAITSANNLDSPDKIFAGQTLIIPGAVQVEPGDGAAVHTVQAGENLFRIGLKYGVSVTELMALNGLVNAEQIYAGQRLVVSGSASPTEPVAEAAPASGGVSHIVRSGETLSSIANQYGVSVWSLTQANRISNPSMIYAGQVVIIPESAAVTSAPTTASLTPVNAAGKQIVVDLSEQRVYVYENGQLLRSFTVSTGLPATPTVTGDYAIYLKRDSQVMSGPGYYFPNVQWVMYFYRGYALHGAYWHNNFGQPMSHGCVNMTNGDAEWLYNWAPIGTPVRVIW